MSCKKKEKKNRWIFVQKSSHHRSRDQKQYYDDNDYEGPAQSLHYGVREKRNQQKKRKAESLTIEDDNHINTPALFTNIVKNIAPPEINLRTLLKISRVGHLVQSFVLHGKSLIHWNIRLSEILTIDVLLL